MGSRRDECGLCVTQCLSGVTVGDAKAERLQSFLLHLEARNVSMFENLLNLLASVIYYLLFRQKRRTTGPLINIQNSFQNYKYSKFYLNPKPYVPWGSEQAATEEALRFRELWPAWESEGHCKVVTATRSSFQDMFDEDDTLAYEPATTAAIILTGGNAAAEQAARQVSRASVLHATWAMVLYFMPHDPICPIRVNGTCWSAS